MTRHLQSAICIIQRTRSICAARVLRVDEFFKNIQMRRFDATSQPVSNSSGKLSDFWNDPLQQIASQDDGGGFGWWCCGCGHPLWQTIEKTQKILFAKWKFADVRRFTANSLHSQQRFDFSLEGLRTPCLRAKMIQKWAFFARNQGCDKLGIGEGRAIVHESFFDFEKFPQPGGKAALQPTAFVATKPWRTPRFGEVKRKNRKWKMEAGSAWRSLQA